MKAVKSVFFLIGHFWALLQLHTPCMAQILCQTQKWSTGLLFLSAFPLNAQLFVLLGCYAKTAQSAFPQKVAFLA